MSKQFHVYLLPADVVSLIEKLSAQFDISLIDPLSSRPSPVLLETPIRQDALLLKGDAVRVDCYIASKNADIKMRFSPGLSRWIVQPESEVIEFRGCEFDGNVLVRGRFYLQNDFLVSDMIAAKHGTFLDWANRIFRLTKKSLYRSSTLDAYIGVQASKWRKEGGRFAWMATPERGPMFETERSIM
jgi:hypothetical protein